MRLIAAVLATVLALAASPASAASVSPAARAQAKAEGTVRVLVALQAPAVPKDAAQLGERRDRIERLRDALLRDLPSGEVSVVHRYRSVAGFAAMVTADGLERLAAHPAVRGIDLDEVGHAALHNSVPQLRADLVHRRGVIGEGTVVAVIDAGVDPAHPDVAGALVHEECFCRAGRLSAARMRGPCCPNATERQSGAGSAAAVDRHGPHVTGIALSRGVVSGVGMAPGASLVAVRVLDEDNLGFLSDWIAALDWLATERPDVRVVNMSLVSQTLFSGDCDRGCEGQTGCTTNLMFADAINELWARGALVFAAAGNDSRAGMMTAPACVERAVSVGAVNLADAVASFSNSSPTLDLLAPGVEIVSDDIGGGLTVISGTSMAAPHATGAAALLLSARPGLNAEQVVSLLRTTGKPVVDQRSGRVTPRIDAFAALKAASVGVELERGGGSRTADCLLEWNVVPPDIVRAGTPPVVRCTDNDPLCDNDQQLGQCTFAYSMCFNIHDPMLRGCAVDEPLQGFVLHSPRIDAPQGSIEHTNMNVLAFALPDFPLASPDTCTIISPFIVERPRADEPGVGRIRMSVQTASRGDYDQIVFACEPPQ